MSGPTSPHPPNEAESEVANLVLAAVSWLNRLDLVLPPSRSGAPAGLGGTAELTLLGGLSLLMRVRDRFARDLARPPAALARPRSRTEWLR